MFTLYEWIECSCGLSMDRDVNAALNTLARARSARVLWVGQTHWGKSTGNRLGLPQEPTPLHRTRGSVQV